jgi:hypothetical protein
MSDVKLVPGFIIEESFPGPVELNKVFKSPYFSPLEYFAENVGYFGNGAGGRLWLPEKCDVGLNSLVPQSA